MTTRPHLQESRPEIQGSTERKRGTPFEDDPPFPKWLLSRNGVTIEQGYARLDQGYEWDILDRFPVIHSWITLVPPC